MAPTPQSPPTASNAWSGLYTIHKGRSMGGKWSHYSGAVMGRIRFVAPSVAALLSFLRDTLARSGPRRLGRGASPRNPLSSRAAQARPSRRHGRGCSGSKGGERISNGRRANVRNQMWRKQMSGSNNRRACLVPAPGRLHDHTRASLRAETRFAFLIPQ